MTDNHITVGRLINELNFWRERYGENFPVTFVDVGFRPVYPVLEANDEGKPSSLIFFIYNKPQPDRDNLDLTNMV